MAKHLVDLHSQIVSALDSSGLTDYGIAQLWAAENDEAVKTNAQRISRIRKRLPQNVRDLCGLLEALGYEVTIEKK